MTMTKTARRVLSLAAFFLCFAAAPARGQSIPSGSCAEEGSGGSPNNFGVTTSQGDTVIVESLSYIGGGLVSNATWSSGTATITVNNHSATGGYVTVSSINPPGYNGTFKLTGHTSTTISYALATNPGTYVSGGSIGGAVQSVTDNHATFPYPWYRLAPDANSNTPVTFALAGGGMDTWSVSDVGAGSFVVSVTYTPGDQFNDSCVLVLHGMGASPNIVDHISNTLFSSGSTTILSPSITGTFQNEIFYSTANIVGTLSGTGVTACGGNTFTPTPGANGQGGDPAGYFITGATTGNICAGLLQSTTDGGAVQIISFKTANSGYGAGVW